MVNFEINVKCSFEATYKLHSGQSTIVFDIPASSIHAAWGTAMAEAIRAADATDGVLMGMSLTGSEVWRESASEHRGSRQ